MDVYRTYSRASEIRTVPSEQCPDLRTFLLSRAKPGKYTIMGAYMAAGSIPYRAAICTLFLEDELYFLLT